MRKTPLTLTEIYRAQNKFEMLTPDKQKILVDLQDRIEECEGVDMRTEIKGLPYKYWCESCKKTYTRMYILLDKWYLAQIAHYISQVVKEFKQTPNQNDGTPW